MADTPQEIKYIIEAEAGEANREMASFIRQIGDATVAMKKLQDEVRETLGGGKLNSQQIRQLSTDLRRYGQGDLQAQTREAGVRREQATRRTDAASVYLRIEKETTKQLERQAEVAGRFVKDYDRLLEITREMRRIGSGPEFERLRATQQGLITGIANRLPEDKRQIQTNYLQEVVGQKNPSEKGRQQATQQFLNRMGIGVDREQVNRALGVYDAGIRAQRESAELASKIKADRQAELDLATKVTAERQRQDEVNKSILRNFRQHHAEELAAIKTRSERDAAFNKIMGGYRGDMNRSGLTIDETRLNDEYARINAQVERMEARTVAAERRAVAAERREDSRRDRRLLMMSGPNAAERNVEAARARMDAYGGAGIFSIQGSLLANYATMAGLVGTAGFLGSNTVQLESSLKELQAISTATDGEMGDLTETILNLTRVTKFSTIEMTEAATVMAQAGLSARQIDEVMPAIAKGAAAAGTDMLTLADTITATMTVFDLQTSEALSVTNTLVAAMNMSKLSIDKYALSLQYAGNIAQTVGIQYNELTAIMSGMFNAGITSGSTAGTGFRQLLLDLQSPTEKAEGVFKRMGLSKADLDVEANGVFEVMRKLKEANFTTADATEAFEVRAVAAFKAIMNQLPTIEELNRNILLTTAAVDANATQMDTLASRWTQFTSGAGAAFYKTTENIRDGLKAVLLAGTSMMGFLSDAGPLLQVVTTASIAFLTAWSIQRLAGIVTGLGQMSSTMSQLHHSIALGGSAAGAWRTAFLALVNPTTIMTAGITAAAVAWGMLDEALTANQRKLDEHREATNRARGDLAETQEVMEAITGALDRLTTKYDHFDKSNEDLATEVLSLQARFASAGLELDNYGGKVDGVIAKLTDFQGTLSETLLLQTQVAIAATEEEKRLAADAGAQNLATGKFKDSELNATELRRATVYFRERQNEVPQELRSSLGAINTVANIQGSLSGLSTEQRALIIERLKPEDILNVQAQISQLQRYYSNELSGTDRTSSPDVARALQERLDNLRIILAWANQITQLVTEQDNFDVNLNSLRATEKDALVSKSQDSRDFANVTATLKGQVGREILNLKRSTDIGADAQSEDFRALQERLRPGVEALQTAKDEMLRRWQEDMKLTAEEAEELFKKQTYSDDYSYVTKIVSRELSKLDEPTRKLLDEAFTSKADIAKKAINRILEESRVQSFKVPAGAYGSVPNEMFDGQPPDVTYQRRSFEESVQALNEAYADLFSDQRTAFGYRYPGAFELDPKDQSRTKDPSRSAEWLAASNQMREEYLEDYAKLARYYQKELGGGTGSGRKPRDARIEVLKGQIDEQKAEMAKLVKDIDSESPAEKVLSTIKQYTEMYADLFDMSMLLEDLEWDDTTWKQTGAEAEVLKAQRMAARQRELQAQEGKQLDDLNNLAGDITGDDLARLLKSRREMQEMVLGSLRLPQGAISDQVVEAQISIAEVMLENVIDTLTAEFWAKSAHREKTDSPELKAELDKMITEYVMSHADIVLRTADQQATNIRWVTSRGLAQADADLGAAGNVNNRGRIGQTENFILGRRRDVAEQRSLMGEIAAQRSIIRQLQPEIEELQNAMAESEEGSDRYNAALAKSNELSARLEAATEGLTKATLAYRQATDTLVNPGIKELFQGSIDSFLESSGVLRSGWEQLADGVPDVMGTFSSEFVQALTDISTHSRDTGDAVEDMARRIGVSLTQLGIEMMTNEMMRMALQWMASSFSSSGSHYSGTSSFDANSTGFDASSSTVGSIVTGAGRAGGGLIWGGIPNRDSVLTPTMPGEYVFKKSAVDMIGVETLNNMNATGQLATNTALMIADKNAAGGDTVNVWVVKEDALPAPGPKDIIAVVGTNIMDGGVLKKMIASVKTGAM